MPMYAWSNFCRLSGVFSVIPSERAKPDPHSSSQNWAFLLSTSVCATLFYPRSSLGSTVSSN